MGDGVEPDRHLRAALRHAPDAGAEPPAALGAAILRAAREAAAAESRRSSTWWAPWWGMPWAGGLASLLVATLLGVLWWREPEPLQEAARQARAPVPTAPASRDDAPEATSTAPPAAAPPTEAAMREAPARLGQPASAPVAPSTPREARRADPPRGQGETSRSRLAKAEAPRAASAASPAPSSAARVEAAPPASSAALVDAARSASAAPHRDELAALSRAAPALPTDGLDADARVWLQRLLAEAGARWQPHRDALPAGRTYRWPAARLVVVLADDRALWQQGDARWSVALSTEQLQRIAAP